MIRGLPNSKAAGQFREQIVGLPIFMAYHGQAPPPPPTLWLRGPCGPSPPLIWWRQLSIIQPCPLLLIGGKRHGYMMRQPTQPISGQECETFCLLSCMLSAPVSPSPGRYVWPEGLLALTGEPALYFSKFGGGGGVPFSC